MQVRKGWGVPLRAVAIVRMLHTIVTNKWAGKLQTFESEGSKPVGGKLLRYCQ